MKKCIVWAAITVLFLLNPSLGESSGLARTHYSPNAQVPSSDSTILLPLISSNYTPLSSDFLTESRFRHAPNIDSFDLHGWVRRFSPDIVSCDGADSIVIVNSFSETILRIANRSGINPRVLIVLAELQRSYQSPPQLSCEKVMISANSVSNIAVDLMQESLVYRFNNEKHLHSIHLNQEQLANDASYAIAYAILKLNESQDTTIFTEEQFYSSYRRHFGEPTSHAPYLDQIVASSSANNFKLPFVGSRGYTSGPHGGRSTDLCKSINAFDASGIDFSGNVDLENPILSAVVAIASGTIVGIRHDTSVPGKWVAIQHGNVVSMYWHLASINPDLSINQQVSSGTYLGEIGDTGCPSCGKHIHLELRTGGFDYSIWAGIGSPYPWSGMVLNGWVIYPEFYDDERVANYNGSALDLVNTNQVTRKHITTNCGYVEAAVASDFSHNGPINSTNTIFADANGSSKMTSSNGVHCPGQLVVASEASYGPCSPETPPPSSATPSPTPSDNHPEWLVEYEQVEIIPRIEYRLEAKITEISKRAARIRIDDWVCSETSGGETRVRCIWDALDFADGWHTIYVEVDQGSDWSNPLRYETSIQLWASANGITPCGTPGIVELHKDSNGNGECLGLTGQVDIPELAVYGFGDKRLYVTNNTSDKDVWMCESSGDACGAVRRVKPGQQFKDVGSLNSKVEFVPTTTPLLLPEYSFTCDEHTYLFAGLGDSGSLVREKCHGRNGTNQAPNIVPGKFGEGQSFVGQHQPAITFGTHNLSCPMSVDFWYRRRGGESQILASQLGGSGNSGQNKWLIKDHGGYITSEIWSNGSSTWRQSYRQITDNQFHHVMFTYDCNRQAKLYLDLELVSQWTTPGLWANGATTLEVGAGEGRFRANGVLDEFRISTIVRAPDNLGPQLAPPTPTPTSTPTPHPIDVIPSQEGELLASWEGSLGDWSYINGGASNPVRSQEYASQGNHSIKLDFSDSWSHFQYSFPQTVDLASVEKVQIHVANPGDPINFKVALASGNNWAWNVAPLQSLPHGAHLIEFDLTAENWDKDGVIGNVANPEQVHAIVIIVEGDNYPGTLYVDNLRKIGQAHGGLVPIPSQDGELLESWESGLGNWPYINGGASAPSRVSDNASDGTYSVKLEFNEWWSHFQYNFAQTVNLSDSTKLQVHLTNPGGPMNLKIALPTGDSWAWNASPAQAIQYGTQLVEFDLTTSHWDKDGVIGPLDNSDQVHAIVFVVEGDNYPGAFYVDNLRNISQPDGLTPIPSQEGELVSSWEESLGDWSYINGGAATPVQVQEYASDGSYSVKLGFSDSWSHFQHTFPENMNFMDANTLQMYALNPGDQVYFKIALATGDSWAWNVAPLQPLPYGAHLVEFDLTASNWDKDGVIGPLINPDQVKAIVFIVEGDNYPGTIYVDNLRASNNIVNFSAASSKFRDTQIYLPLIK